MLRILHLFCDHRYSRKAPVGKEDIAGVVDHTFIGRSKRPEVPDFNEEPPNMFPRIQTQPAVNPANGEMSLYENS